LDAYALREAEQEIAERMMRLLRCYDSLGRFGDGEYGLVLPGCNCFNAVGMAERLKEDVFSSTICAGHDELKFEGSFGIAGSGGRSPVVVLRNAENALRAAMARGVGSIDRISFNAEPDPATLLIPVIGDEALHW
jgi:GGDEF domain-containing protein